MAPGGCPQAPSSHPCKVDAVAVLGADRIVSGSWDNALGVWSLAPGGCPQAPSGHSHEVNTVAVLGADRTVGGGHDQTLEVWSVTGRRRHMAALQINRHWRDAIGNPERKLCRKWLARQCE